MQSMNLYSYIPEKHIKKKGSSICDNSTLENTINKNLILLFPTQLRFLDIKIKFNFFTLLWLTKDWHLQWK